jgi:hypothetical protein
LLYAQSIQVRKPLVQRLEQRRCRLRMKYRPTMRIKGDGRRMCADLLGTLDDLLHYLLVPEMKPVKNT